MFNTVQAISGSLVCSYFALSPPSTLSKSTASNSHLAHNSKPRNYLTRTSFSFHPTTPLLSAYTPSPLRSYHRHVPRICRFARPRRCWFAIHSRTHSRSTHTVLPPLSWVQPTHFLWLYFEGYLWVWHFWIWWKCFLPLCRQAGVRCWVCMVFGAAHRLTIFLWLQRFPSSWGSELASYYCIVL